MASVATLRDLIEALIKATKEEGHLDKVTRDLERFFRFISSKDEIRNILSSSVYDARERKEIIGEIGIKAGFDKLTINFINLVIELGKFKALLKSETLFMQKLRKASGKVNAEVVVAVDPSKENLHRIQEKLNKLLGKDVEITLKVDSSILGGVIAKVEDRVFDGSIKTQLERIRRILSLS
jgi:F-type H+-transporting ATPase subunit delta